MVTRTKDQNTYAHGEWNAICDVCGFKFKASDLKKRWDGFMVCKDDWELRHESDFFRAPKEDQNVAWTRPDSVPATSSYTDVGGNSVSTDTLPDVYTSGRALLTFGAGEFTTLVGEASNIIIFNVRHDTGTTTVRFCNGSNNPNGTAQPDLIEGYIFYVYKMFDSIGGDVFTIQKYTNVSTAIYQAAGVQPPTRYKIVYRGDPTDWANGGWVVEEVLLLDDPS